MPVRKEYTVEFKEQAVRFVFDEIGPDERARLPSSVSLRG